MSRFRTKILIAPLFALTLGLSPSAHTEERAAAPVDKVNGYLAALPDATLLPAPPAFESAGDLFDRARSRDALVAAIDKRRELAKADVDSTFPAAAGIFACALGVGVTEQDTPHLYQLLRRIKEDSIAAVRPAKKFFARVRPSAVNKGATCQVEKADAAFESYPSGHATVGWIWAQILAELAPEHSDAVLARGLAYGESRVVCNVHWDSDLAAGRLLATAVVARLRADPEFAKDLALARQDLADARAKPLKPQRDCAAEDEALKQKF